MTHARGVMILVLSRRPPKPVFDDGYIDVAASEVVESHHHGKLEKRRVDFSDFGSRYLSTNSSTASRVIISPLTRMRSRKSMRWGEV